MLWNNDFSPNAEPFKVLLKRGEFTDENRGGRTVPFKIYYPVEHGRESLPVIIWSHGFGGNRDGASFISRYVAGHGYIIIHVTHPGTDSSLWEGKAGHPWDILRTIKVPRAASLNRFRDIPFVLDRLPGWMAEHDNLAACADFDRLGMSGHSFGAMTAQVMAGQKFPDEDGYLQQIRENRFTAGILYSPVPIRHLLRDEPDAEIYGPIDLPLFHMTGTDDASPIEHFGYEHRLAVYNHSGRADRHLLILKDGDHMVFNGTRGKLAVNPKRERHEEIIRVASLAYWEAYLRRDDAARVWLEENGFQDFIGEGATFGYKKP